MIFSYRSQYNFETKIYISVCLGLHSLEDIYEWFIYLFDKIKSKKYRLFCTRKYKRHTFKKAYKFLIDIYLACFFCLTIFCPWFFHIFRASFPILEIYFLFNLLFIQIWKIQDFSKIPIFGMKFEWSQISFLSQFKRIFTEIPMIKDLKKYMDFCYEIWVTF